jgi:hypothetical protein
MKVLRGIAIAILGFLGVSAMVGAIPLILDPTGRMLSMPMNLLEYSPFHSYLIPGIILLTANGFLSLWVLYISVRRRQGYGWWVAFQGCVIAGWIVVEMIMLRMVIWAHYVYLAVGITLISLGLALRRENRTA